MVRAAWLLAWVGVGACVDPTARECDDGTTCPADRACAPAGGACVAPEVVEACAGLEEGAACASEDGPSTCRAGLCRQVRCGDSFVDPPEVCDDGNVVSGDGCSATCGSTEACGDGVVDPLEECDCGTGSPRCGGRGNDGVICTAACALARCGNGALDVGEACDDGNNISGDGCDSICRSVETCGNGVIDVATGEACDDGNVAAGDGCQDDCRLPACGDGVVDGAAAGRNEACDDGNALGGDGCSANCLSTEQCGNATVDAGEQCDDGAFADLGGCRPGCRLPICSDREINGDPLEACDDGNTVSGDGCTASCQATEACGNGVVDVGESCDCVVGAADVCDGRGNDGVICTSGCVLARCGNGALDVGEVCDDGNNANNDGCNGACLSNEVCGNGFLDIARGEQCDDGNTLDGDTCQAGCRLPRCGDGVVDDPVEVCDDGATDGLDGVLVDGDGCARDCRSDETCGNDVRDPGEQCDAGGDNSDLPNATATPRCRTDCEPQRCGDQIVDPGAAETCDDGNNVNFDACLASCTINVCGDGQQRQVGTPAEVEACDFGAGNAPSALCTPDCELARCGDGYTFPVTEDCDDANTDPQDACLPSCRFNVCGDGFFHVGVEICEDGNLNDGDSCTSLCRPNVCGDGFRWDGVEGCDDGNLVSGDGCSETCVDECGNGVVDGGEACDDGGAWVGNGCVACQPAGCGDGELWLAIEQCDDGNLTPNDGCSPTCVRECGDGTPHNGEECDDGNRDPYDQCTNDCQQPTCGDGVVEGPEQCDLGSANGTTAACSYDCKPACPDVPGVVQSANVCYTLSSIEATWDAASAACTLAAPLDWDAHASVSWLAVNTSVWIGLNDRGSENTFTWSSDSSVPGSTYWAWGQPDDGLAQDAASAGQDCVAQFGGLWFDQDCDSLRPYVCQERLALCGDGYREGAEGCDDANTSPGDGCDGACRLECGNGHQDANEACDDGNNVDGDGCSSDCRLAVCWAGRGELMGFRGVGHDSCMLHMPASTTYGNAAAYCGLRGTRLPEAYTAATDAAIRAASRGEAWLGLVSDSAGVFRWGSGNPLTYAAWLPGEPDSPVPGSCASYLRQGWADRSCSDVIGVVCELRW